MYERAAQGFDAFPHSAYTVAIGIESAAAIISNFKDTIAVIPRNPQAAVARMRMTHDIGYRLSHDQRRHALLGRTERQLG